jgi:general secretion pathway protein G
MRSVRNTVAKGFTLVEILIVVVILGILAAIVVPQFTNAANEARGGNVATQVSTIETQLELWAARNSGVYPDLASAGETWQDLVDAGYFKEIPTNPFNNSSVINAWPAGAETANPAIFADGVVGWYYDATTGNIAAAAPAAAAP